MGILSKIGEYFKPTKKVRVRDVVREAGYLIPMVKYFGEGGSLKSFPGEALKNFKNAYLDPPNLDPYENDVQRLLKEQIKKISLEMKNEQTGLFGVKNKDSYDRLRSMSIDLSNQYMEAGTPEFHKFLASEKINRALAFEGTASMEKSAASKFASKIAPSISKITREGIESVGKKISDRFGKLLDSKAFGKLDKKSQADEIGKIIHSYVSQHADDIIASRVGRATTPEIKSMISDRVKRIMSANSDTEQKVLFNDMVEKVVKSDSLKAKDIDINKLKSIGDDLEIAKADFAAGRKSMTKLPILVKKDTDGMYTIIDGNRRYLQHLEDGKTTIKATENEAEYIKLVKKYEENVPAIKPQVELPKTKKVAVDPLIQEAKIIQKPTYVSNTDKDPLKFLKHDASEYSTKEEWFDSMKNKKSENSGGYKTNETVFEAMSNKFSKQEIESIFKEGHKKYPGNIINNKVKQANPLIQEAKKYNSAEEFVKAMEAGGDRVDIANRRYKAMNLNPTEIGSYSTFDIMRMNQPGNMGDLNRWKLSVQDLAIQSDLISKEVLDSARTKGMSAGEFMRKGKIDIYRVVPKGEKINAGDFVFDTKSSAEKYLKEYGVNRGATEIQTIKNVGLDELLLTDNPNYLDRFEALKRSRGEFIYAPKNLQNSIKTKSQLTDIWNKANHKVPKKISKAEQRAMEIAKGDAEFKQTLAKTEAENRAGRNAYLTDKMMGAEKNKSIQANKQFAKEQSVESLKQEFGTIQPSKKEIRDKSIKEIKSLIKVIREKGLEVEAKSRLREELGLGKPIRRGDVVVRQGFGSLKEDGLKQAKQILGEVINSPKPKPNYEGVKFGKLNLGKSQTGLSKAKQGIVQTAENVLSSISTNIKKYGGRKLFYRIRKFEENRLKRGIENATNIKEFMKGVNKMSNKWFKGKALQEKLTYALYNQDFDTAREMARKYKFEEGFNKVVDVLKKTRQEMLDAGIKVGELQDYFPRVVKDYDGLYQAYNEKFGKSGKEYFDKLINDWARKHYMRIDEVSVAQRAEILTNALRGYGERINVASGKMNLSRKFKELPPEFLKFYQEPQKALTMYLDKANERIELQKLLKKDTLEGDVIGRFVDGLEMTPAYKRLLQENLSSYLNRKSSENAVLHKIRTVATATLLGNINFAITQLADIGFNITEHGTMKALASWFRKKPFKRDKMFTELAHEFGDSKWTTRILKATGGDRIDRLNNESFMANAFRKGIRLAKKESGGEYEKFVSKVRDMFPENEVAQVLDDFKNKRVTDKTRTYIFNEALDFSPRTRTEMPKGYLDHPNARIFYSMKTWSIKALDVYRNQVIREPRKYTKLKNAIKLTAVLTMAGATTDQIKDWWAGKDTDFHDNVGANVLKIFMLSRYDATKASTDGLGRALMYKILPSTQLFDDISRDVINSGDGKGLYSVRNVPVIGKELYNRIGRGKDSIEKANAKNGKVKSYKDAKNQYNAMKRKALEDTPYGQAKKKFKKLKGQL